MMTHCAFCEERISDFLEEALPAQERSALQEHFQECASCSNLLADVRALLEATRALPSTPAPPWLAVRIVANTPPVVRETWADTVRAAWRWILEPRIALAVFTATLVLGWLGGQVGLSLDSIADLRHPTTIYAEAQGVLNGAYNEALKAYYRSPVVTTIQCRIQQLRESS